MWIFWETLSDLELKENFCYLRLSYAMQFINADYQCNAP